MSLILLCLLIAIYFDSILFKQRDPELFKMAFQFSIWKILLSLLLILSVLIFCENRWEDLPLLVLLLVLPVYLLRRGRFVKSMEWKGGQDISTLISSALGVIIVWFYGVIAFGLLTSSILLISKKRVPCVGSSKPCLRPRDFFFDTPEIEKG